MGRRSQRMDAIELADVFEQNGFTPEQVEAAEP